MKNTLRNLALAAAFATSYGTISTAATTDLAFIMDRSGSINENDFINAMTSLANALGNSIPTDEPDNRYSITVITFAGSSTANDVVVSPTLVQSQSDLNSVTSAITTAGNNISTGGTTCYSCAFDRLRATVTTFGENSIINMMTDGGPNEGATGQNLFANRNLLNDGSPDGQWDSLSFEAINLDSDGEALLSDLAFDTLGVGNQPVFLNANQITDPLKDAFVLRVADFGTAYTQAIDTKVQRSIDPISPVPVPAALPLLLAGLGMIGALRLRKSRTAAA